MHGGWSRSNNTRGLLIVLQVQNMATKSGDSDDLVITAFKKQQKQYQDLMKGLQVCICPKCFL
jgi:hypothetical protein